MPAALEQRFVESLPFALTGAQARVLAEVDRDLAALAPDGAAGAGRRRLRQDRGRRARPLRAPSGTGCRPR